LVIHTDLDLHSAYQLGEKLGCRVYSISPLGLGSGNSNYLFDTDQGQIVASIIEEQNYDETVIMAMLLLHLEDYDYPSSRLISPAMEESLILEYKGKPIIFREYLEGRVVRDLSLSVVEEVGESLACLHQIPPPDFLEGHYYYSDEFKKVYGMGFDPDFENWLVRVLSEGEKENRNLLPSGLIHGDLFYDNVLVSGHKLGFLIDFELACHQVFAFDLAMALIGICQENINLDERKTAALLRGYEKHRNLTDLEWLHLKDLAIEAAALTANWRYWKYLYKNPDPLKRSSYLDMQLLAQSISGISPREFIRLVR